MAKEIENININGEEYEVGKIYSKMGLSYERFVELLERDFYCPVLSAAPTPSTVTYTDTDGNAHEFQTGQFALVADPDMTEGYKVWQCLRNSGTEATWTCAHDTMTGYVSGQLSAKQDKISDLDTIRSNAAKGATALQSYTETDPTVPSWAKATSKPTYTADEVGALPNTTVVPSKVSDLTNDSGFTSNTGTITGITMNGSSKGTSGTVNLGYVIIGDGTITKIVKVSSLPSSPESTTLYIIPE